MKKIQVSFVTSTYNCAIYVSQFIDSILNLSKISSFRCEIIIVDDHSEDGTWEELTRRAKKLKTLKIIRLSRNQGQQVAVSAALKFISDSSNVVVLLDSDGQHPLNVIPEMVEKVLSGVDIVYTVSKVRNSKSDALTSGIFWILAKRFISPRMIENQLMLKALSLRAVEFINLYKEGRRVLAAIVTDIGLKTDVMHVRNQKSRVDARNHNFFARLNIMIDLLLSGSSRLLDKIIIYSAVSLFFSFLFSLWTAFGIVFAEDPPSGYLTLVALILFFGNSIMVFLGLIARYISNVYSEVLSRPLFLIESRINV